MSCYHDRVKWIRPQRETGDRQFPVREFWILFGAALVLKLVFLATVRHSPFVAGLTNDEWHHWHEALEILSNGIIRPDVFYFAPLYPYFLAGLFALTGPNLTVVLVLNAVFGAMTVALSYALAVVMSGRRRSGLISALFVVLFAPFYLYEVLVLKTTMATTLAVAALLSLMCARKREGAALWVLSGLSFGALALLRGNALIVLPILAAELVFEHLDGRLESRRLFLWLACVGLAIAPATLHNLVAGSDLVPTTFQGGTQFWIGNHSGATGMYVPLRPGRGLPAQEKYDAVSLAEEFAGHELPPSRVNSFWLRRGLSFVVKEPLNWVRLMGRKTRLSLSNTEIGDVVHIDVFEEEASYLKAAFLPFGVLAGLALGGVWLRREQWRNDLPVWVMTAGSLFSIILFFVFGRYRVPVAPLLAVVAGVGLDCIPVFLKERRRTDLFVGGILAATVFGLASIPVTEDSPLISFNTLGGLYLRQDKADEALACFERVVKASPNDPVFRANLALALERLGRVCDAAEHRREIERRWWDDVVQSRDTVSMIQYLFNAELLREDSRNCPNTVDQSTLRDRMRRVARELHGRRQRGLFEPGPEAERLISRSLLEESSSANFKPFPKTGG